MKTAFLSILLVAALVAKSASIQVAAGNSQSNAFVGGMITHLNVSYTNLNGSGTLTNLAGCTIAAFTLTNVGDSITATWCGKFAIATPNTNQFTMVYGSQTFLDTGLQPISNGSFYATINLTCTGPTAQHAQGWFTWQAGPSTVFGQTNINVELSQTNGIDTLLVMKGAARRGGAHTNNALRVYYEPAVRP
jgi:hypothetical protein